MDTRLPLFCTFLLLILLSVSAACASASSAPPGTAAAPPAPVTTPAGGTVPAAAIATGDTPAPSAATRAAEIDAELASVKSESPVFREAYRMFRNIKSTEYVHPPYTDDDAAGIYRFDCLGFVDHVLMNATPEAYREIGKGANPSIESYAAAFGRLGTKSPVALQGTPVGHPVDLQPGDVCLWLKPSTLDDGHMWIIAGEPETNPKRTGEVLVRIFDSTGTPHSSDSRTGPAFPTGLGTGILGFMVDGDGNAAGLYWEGGASTAAGEKDTTIVCGRLNG